MPDLHDLNAEIELVASRGETDRLIELLEQREALSDGDGND